MSNGKTYSEDSKHSTRIFKDFVWPIIKSKIGGGELLHAEDLTDNLMRKFDMLSGVDAWQVVEELGVRGIASRVQWAPRGFNINGKPYNTFSIRYDRDTGTNTEYSKRTNAIDRASEGWVYPYYTMQAYATDNGPNPKILSVGIIDTKTLFEFVKEQLKDPKPEYLTFLRSDNAEAIYIQWSDIQYLRPGHVCYYYENNWHDTQLPSKTKTDDLGAQSITVNNMPEDWGKLVAEQDNPTPCKKCGSQVAWKTMTERWRCQNCDPPVKAQRWLERAENLRQRPRVKPERALNYRKRKTALTEQTDGQPSLRFCEVLKVITDAGGSVVTDPVNLKLDITVPPDVLTDEAKAVLKSLDQAYTVIR